jgi:hypothetical protein
LVSYDKSSRLADIHLLHQFPIEERGFHIHVMNLPPFLTRQHEEDVICLHPLYMPNEHPNAAPICKLVDVAELLHIRSIAKHLQVADRGLPPCQASYGMSLARLFVRS